MSEINDLKFTALPGDLLKWEWFFKELEKRELVTIYGVSPQISGRDSSKLKWQYFKIKLRVAPPEQDARTLSSTAPSILDI